MVTVIGLPLLIVNGKFQSLSTMTVEDLETFIPFLTKCSINRAGAQLINGVPEWWSSTIQYKFPLKKPNGLSQNGYHKHLSAIVCSCYWYHDAQYLIPFCAKIAARPQSVYLQNNGDNTTSIFSVQNTSHVLKFNNENKNYDIKPKRQKPQKPSKRSLLSALPKKPTTIIPDIYLCENCDAEFSSQSEMQKHEKECFADGITESHKNVNGNSVTRNGGKRRKTVKESEELEILEHIKPSIDSISDKNKYFSYLMLKPKNCDKVQMLPILKNETSPHSHRWLNVDLRLHKYDNVEFSSLLGKKVSSYKRETISKLQRTYMINEFYCSTSTTGRTNRDHREPMDYKVTYKRVKKSVWTHQYCFNKQQRRSRLLTLKTGLNEHSRKLLRQCKRLRIVVKRLKIPS